MEPVDVLDQAYDVFDSTGRQLSVDVQNGGTRIAMDAETSSDEEQLVSRLRHFITRVGPDRVGVSEVATLSLRDAIEALKRFFLMCRS
jgi:hypothetical protein